MKSSVAAPLRVAVLTRSTTEHARGGMEVHLDRLLHQLTARGIDVTVLTTAYAGCTDRCMHDARVIHLPGTSPGRWTPAFAVAAARAIAELETARPFDIFHSQSTAAQDIPGIDGRLVLNYHGILLSESPLAWTNLRALGAARAGATIWRCRRLLRGWLAMYRADRRLIARASRLVAVSKFARSRLVRWFPGCTERVRVIYNGVDTARFRPRPDPSFEPTAAPTILSVGRLEETKGAHVLVDAFARLARPVDARLLIAGIGPAEPALRRQIQQLGMDESVRLLGLVPDGQLPALHASADLFVHPELTTPAFGLVTAEALSSGVPVIASRAGALPELVSPDVGRLVAPGNAGALAQVIDRLLVDRPRLERLSQAARQRAEQHFSETRWIDGLLGTYEDVARSAGG